MDTLNLIAEKYGLDLKAKRMPIEIPNVGRDDLAILFAELGFRIGVEVGIERGLYSEVLCRANPGLKLFCVDPWRTYGGYREHVSQEKLNRFYLETKERLAPFDCILLREFSMRAVQDFDYGSLDFVYIDGNHSLPFIVNDIIEWTKRVRPGGIVSGHDYRQTKNREFMAHVVYAVQAYTQAYRVWPWFLLGRREKRPGEVRDNNRSWMWVNDESLCRLATR